MATKTMTMHELLVAIKMTKKRLDAYNLISGTAFISTATRNQLESNKDEAESVRTTLIANLQKVTALISNLDEYEKVRASVNATTKFTVGGKEMTISDAIKLKENIGYRKQLLNKLKDEYAAATKNVSNENRALTTRLDKNYAYASDALPETIQAMTAAKETEYSKNETVLVDPNKVSEYIEKLTEEIDNFEGTLDAALSYINAVTQVEVTLAD